MATKVERPLEWMRFDPVKFMHLIDELTTEQVGVVSKLMLKLWQFGAMTEQEVRRVARGNFDVIRERMSEVDGLLSFAMVEEARSYGRRISASASLAGIKSAEKRKNTSTTVERPLNEVPTDVLSLSKSKSISKSDSESKSEKKERASEPEIIPVGMSADLWSALKRWEQYRVESRKKLTPSGKEALIKQCMAMGDQRAIAAIDHSIAQGWQGMYEPKQATNGQSSEQQRAANYERILAERYPNG